MFLLESPWEEKGWTLRQAWPTKVCIKGFTLPINWFFNSVVHVTINQMQLDALHHLENKASSVRYKDLLELSKWFRCRRFCFCLKYLSKMLLDRNHQKEYRKLTTQVRFNKLSTYSGIKLLYIWMKLIEGESKLVAYVLFTNK